MRKIILLVMAVAMVGCGKKTTPAEPETNAETKAEWKIPANAFVNTLGMPFVPVLGTEIQFCIWETRVKDYATYATANAGVNGKWKQTPAYFKEKGIKQTDTHPVVEVSWEEAGAFCEWLTKKEMAVGKNQGGAEVPIADRCRVERGSGLGPGEGEHAQGEEGRYQGRVPVGQRVATAEGGGEL